MYNCPICGKPLCWQSDFDLEETHSDLSGYSGISSIWSCGRCEMTFEYLFIETEEGCKLAMIFLFDDNEDVD